MEKIFKVAIIGGGASGLLAAIELVIDGVIRGEDVAILERMDRLGKKLSVTGNGQGNLTNKNVSENYYHGDKDFILEFIKSYNSINLEDYLLKLGIPLTFDKKGKAYPLSKQASSVTDVLRTILNQKGVRVYTNFHVENVFNKSGIFNVYSKEETLLAENVILATGGKSAKHFGTDGTAYSLAQEFGHKVSELYPSLVQLKVERNCIKGLNGVKEQAKVRAFDGEKELKTSIGDVLFTDYGVSGSAVFEVSSYLTNAKNPTLKLEFLPEYSKEELHKIIEGKILKFGVKNCLTAVLNNKISEKILKEVEPVSTEIINRVKEYSVKITGTLGFNYAQVTKGGVLTNEICPKSFKSLKQENLYIIGEALNVDGDCGGYNLTFAFISGIISARNVKKRYILSK